MCSVVGCDSGRRGTQRFKLPEDPERRLEWVQFLATVNTQRFKESSWTDITICSEHFEDDCFDSRTRNHPGVTGKVQLTLRPGAVPSLCLRSEETTCVEPEETTEVACLRDQLKTCDGPTTFSEESMAVQGSPTEVVSCSTDTSNAFVSGQMQPKHMDFDLIGQKAALLQMKGKYVVNEKRLLKLFSRKCPSCGSQVQMEKVTCGLLMILNQQCLQCDYRNQWKSQVDASVPRAEDQHLTEVEEVTPESQQAVPTGATGAHEIVAVIDEQSEPIDESSGQGDLDSDDDWKQANGSSHARVLIKKIEEETEEEDDEEEDDGDEEDVDEEEEDGDYPPLPVKHSRLCTECGVLYNKQRPHTCEHKIKPFSCNICGKRCVSEKALITHSRIHDENYEYQCKYCHATFKTKVDKITHEQVHVIQGKPYKCPDCPETFATNKERRIHLEDHRGPQQLKCPICGIDFLWPLSLQRHLAVHTGDRPFKCSECQRGFKQAGHLKSHMRLHTGERPYKCPHCDKCFNHNVSLKSHVQRYHSPGSERERMKEKRNKRASDTSDAQDNWNKRGADSGLDNVEDEQDTEEEEEEEAAQREMIYRPKKKSTGRPIGRPKRHEPGYSEEGQSSNAKSGKPKARKSKRTQCRDEESEAKPSDSGTCDSAEEESSKEAIKNTARSRGRPNNSDSDCDFDPEERKKKRYSSGKSSGKRRGRPRRNLKGDS
ncbi:transcription factor E4F1-like isoform X1 [Anarrhichthys ocellatus]|uniref:transcription factor E4F1-like isoform X1 n=1 Tax=Anarrhichthys ocellatus TaxID=433405 RepID=UPI0012ED995C|nr:transcription factor E4F1-like isoform X1 [Anarrhichthys ocellatus]